MKIIYCLAFVLSFAFQGIGQNAPQQSVSSVSFTLLNKSLKDIPLKIPGYMNPNLSPRSDSGVTVKIGQKIFFKYKGKKRLLLVASEELEGKELVVNKLIKEKKAEIDASKEKHSQE